MHIVSDMCKYGKLKESNTEVGEKNHKVFAKCIGCCCRKQHITFAKQVSSHLSEAFIINKVAITMGVLDKSKVLECDVPEEVMLISTVIMLKEHILQFNTMARMLKLNGNQLLKSICLDVIKMCWTHKDSVLFTK